MPKVVNRDERKRVIVEAAWRIIADRGIDGVTMRDLASETGYANGALARYFDGKDEILELAYQHVIAATDQRIDRATSGRRGIEAAQAMCAEIMPLTDEARLEGRIAIALWQRALTDRAMRDVDEDAVARWSERLSCHLTDAVKDGEVARIDAGTYAALLMNMMIGLQISAGLRTSPSSDEQRAMLMAVFDPVRV